MKKLIVAVGVAVSLIASAGSASAYSSSISPIALSGGWEQVVISYSSSLSFTLSSLTLSSGSGNVLANGGALQPYTGSGGSVINAGSSQITELINATAGNYTFSYTTNATDFVNFSVSPVPLPASLPLFALAALAGIGAMAFSSKRRRHATPSEIAV